MTWRVRATPRVQPDLKVYSGRIADARIEQHRDLAFDNADIVRGDFRGIELSGSFTAKNSRFADCSFEGAKLGSGSFGIGPAQSVYMDCRFESADLGGVWNLGNVRFERCSFAHARVHDWWADAAEFIDCRFEGRLTQCRFAGRPWGRWLERGRLEPPRRTNAYQGNDFRDAELIDCSFVYGIDLDAQHWPSDPHYLVADRPKQRIAAARSQIAEWPDPVLRHEAEQVLEIFEREGLAEQTKVLLRRGDLGTEVGNLVVDMLIDAKPSDIR